MTLRQESASNLRNIGQLVTETAVPPIKGDKFSILLLIVGNITGNIF